MDAIALIVVSSVFRKENEQVAILPPPPPFPDMEEDEDPQPFEHREADSDEHKRGFKNGAFNFFHKTGFAKTEHGKNELKRQQQEYQQLRSLSQMQHQEESHTDEPHKDNQPVDMAGIDEKVSEHSEKTSKEDKRFFFFRRKQAVVEPPATDEGSLETKTSISEEHHAEPTKKKSLFGSLFGKKKHVDTKEKDERVVSDAIVVEPEEKHAEVAAAEAEITAAVETAQKEEKSGIFSDLFAHKKEQGVVKDDVVVEKLIEPKVWEKIDQVHEIEEKVHKARLALMDFKFDMAKKLYLEVMDKYNSLDQTKQAKVYGEIKSLYDERKSAEKFSA